MTDPDTSKEAVEALALVVPESQPYSNNLYNAAETLRALAAENERLKAQVDEANHMLADAYGAHVEGSELFQERLKAQGVAVKPLVWVEGKAFAEGHRERYVLSAIETTSAAPEGDEP